MKRYKTNAIFGSPLLIKYTKVNQKYIEIYLWETIEIDRCCNCPDRAYKHKISVLSPTPPLEWRPKFTLEIETEVITGPLGDIVGRKRIGYAKQIDCVYKVFRYREDRKLFIHCPKCKVGLLCKAIPWVKTNTI